MTCCKRQRSMPLNRQSLSMPGLTYLLSFQPNAAEGGRRTPPSGSHKRGYSKSVPPSFDRGIVMQSSLQINIANACCARWDLCITWRDLGGPLGGRLADEAHHKVLVGCCSLRHLLCVASCHICSDFKTSFIKHVISQQGRLQSNRSLPHSPLTDPPWQVPLRLCVHACFARCSESHRVFGGWVCPPSRSSFGNRSACAL